MLKKRLIIILGVLLILSIPLMARAQDDDGIPVIVFYSVGTGYSDIYLLDLTTLTQYRLTDDIHSNSFPSLSPDGTQVAFQSNRNGGWQIYVLDLATMDMTQLTENGNHYYPQWSPDGSQLAYTDASANVAQIAVRDMTTGDVRLVTDSNTNNYLPHWSADGEEIVVTAGGDIITITQATGDMSAPLVVGDGWETDPDWSPDGRYVLYTTGAIGADDLYVVYMNTGEIFQITDATMDEIDPTWSPDSKQIAFAGDENDDGAYDLFIMTRDGTNHQQLTDRYDNRAPSWGILRVPLSNFDPVEE